MRIKEGREERKSSKKGRRDGGIEKIEIKDKMKKKVLRIKEIKKKEKKGGKKMIVDKKNVIEDKLCFIERLKIRRIEDENEKNEEIMRIDRRWKIGEIEIKEIMKGIIRKGSKMKIEDGSGLKSMEISMRIEKEKELIEKILRGEERNKGKSERWKKVIEKKKDREKLRNLEIGRLDDRLDKGKGIWKRIDWMVRMM